MMVIMVSVKSMIKNILDYLRYSDISLTVNLNPRLWWLDYEYMPPDSMNPKAHVLLLRVVMFKLIVSIDDGSW